MAINKEWHIKNKMIKNAKFEDRVKWHLEYKKIVHVCQVPKKFWIR